MLTDTQVKHVMNQIYYNLALQIQPDLCKRIGSLKKKNSALKRKIIRARLMCRKVAAEADTVPTYFYTSSEDYISADEIVGKNSKLTIETKKETPNNK